MDASAIYAMIVSSSGGARELARLAGQGQVTLVVSGYAFDEAARSFVIKDPQILDLLRLFRAQPFWVWREHTREDVIEARKHVNDPFDAPIIAAAKRAEVDGLVSFDRKHLHTRAVEEFIGAPVLTAGDALALVRKNLGL
ncbi:MAG TPA: PIN domain-containing protein [Thermoflexales bacterium]|nr:PIN domain-containing protein [Thermoflexales bacterium]HQW35262.1 PIN domain-containing protein [Thermoflexales bacterium]HQZ23482.1 PIN domain-containing protein [Thermoflexales bacterium]HRA00142.1 PIN domain-containing protein [Thermoflexales bacterium]